MVPQTKQQQARRLAEVYGYGHSAHRFGFLDPAPFSHIYDDFWDDFESGRRGLADIALARERAELLRKAAQRDFAAHKSDQGVIATNQLSLGNSWKDSCR